MKKYLSLLLALLFMLALLPAQNALAITEYGIWVGDSEITSENRNGEGWSYEPDTNTLTLADPTITTYHMFNSSEGARIYASGDLVLAGSAAISATGYNPCVRAEGSIVVRADHLKFQSDKAPAISSTANLSIENGQLEAISTGSSSYGLYADGSISIGGGDVTAHGTSDGVLAHGGFSMTGGTLDAQGKCGICGAESSVSITGGSVKAVGTLKTGILADLGITIGNGVTRVEAQGKYKENSGQNLGAMASLSSIELGNHLLLEEPAGGYEGSITVNGTDFAVIMDGPRPVEYVLFAPDPVTYYEVWVGDTEITSEKLSGEGWSYDPESNTLSLDDPTVTTYHLFGSSVDAAMIFASGDLVIEGSATLEATGSYHWTVSTGGSLTLRNCALTLLSEQPDAVETGGDFTLESGTLIASGGPGMSTIKAHGDIRIEGGSLTVDSNCGIRAFGDLSISGGTVTVTCSRLPAIRSTGSLSISGGTVEARGGTSGLFAKSVSITGGTVTAIGASASGISCPERGGLITLGNGITRVEAQGVIGDDVATALGAMYGYDGISLGDKLCFLEPEGGQIGPFHFPNGGSGSGNTALDRDGNIATRAVIEPIRYEIRFVNDDGTPLASCDVPYGTSPVYEGETPTKEADAQYSYTFIGWKDADGTKYAADAQLPAVEGEATYTAVYSSSLNEYKVTVVDYTLGAASCSLSSGAVNSYGTEYAFTVASADDQAVLVAARLGDAITVLPCTTEDGVHNFSFTLTGGTELVLALKGDVNYDGTLTTKEGTMIKSAVVGPYEITDPLSLLLADVDGSGELETRDGTMLARAVIGIFTIEW